jgi:hypothetical protein
MKMLLRLLLLATTFTFAGSVALCQKTTPAGSLVITPERLANGSPCLIMVELPTEATAVKGRWQGNDIVFFPAPGNHTWYALAGVDVEAAPGHYPLAVEAHLKNGRSQSLHREVIVEEAPYAKVTLHVPDKFVTPDADALKTIAADKIVKDMAFADTASVPEWSGDFLPPLKSGARSDSYGTRRVFNGTLASVHRGLDYHAATGTQVAAVNSGRVVLAQPLYYEGNCIIIDHGLGLTTVYMHLSKFKVAVGDEVTRGQVIALSGGTGRATGPHLHLGVRWHGSYLDPAKLFALRLPKPHADEQR